GRSPGRSAGRSGSGATRRRSARSGTGTGAPDGAHRTEGAARDAARRSARSARLPPARNHRRAIADESRRRGSGAGACGRGIEGRRGAPGRGPSHRTRRLPHRVGRLRSGRDTRHTLEAAGRHARRRSQLAGSVMNDARAPLHRYLQDCKAFAATATPLQTHGRLTRIAGLVMEAVGLKLPLGSTCVVRQDGGYEVEAEVVGFAGDRLFLMPASDPYGLTPGAAVCPLEIKPLPPAYGKPRHPWRRAGDRTKLMPVGPELLGRVVDCAGRPLDNRGPLEASARMPLHSRPANPIDREQITHTLDVGVRAINTLITVGRGQRMGLFAGSGVGKSVLLGMMARYTSADVIVVGLIGERGREVKEFIEEILGT